MTAAAARSAAVLCALRRTAAERRALRVVLFLGGVLALGFLFGGQAHAAESSAPASPASVEVEVEAEVEAGASGEAGTEVSVTPSQETRRVATDSVGSVGSVDSVREVTQPVTDTVRHLTQPLTQVSVPGPIPAPVPGPVPPVQLTPPGDDAEQGRTQQLAVHLPVHEFADRATAKSPAGRADQVGSGHTTFSTVLPLGGYESADDRRWVDARRERPASVPAPAPSKPCNSSQGALHQSGETHTPRAGDQHAATSAYGTPYADVPGAVSAAAEPPTREMPRDILEFPG